MADETWIGKDFSSPEMLDKVRGRALYGRDLSFPQLLQGMVLRSPHSHALIKEIKTEEARSIPGVRAILTGEELQIPLFGQAIKDEELLARERVRYVGDEVAVVAAETQEAAARALSCIRVEYGPLPSVFHPQEAMSQNAPLLHPEKGGNVAVERSICRGDPSRAWQKVYRSIEHTFQVHPIYQGYMEPIHAIAALGEEGRVNLYTALQSPHITRDFLAEALGMEAGQLRIISPRMGGGFGGKVYGNPKVYLLAILLAQKTRRPVQLSMSRREDITCGRPQGGVFYQMRLGVKQDGGFLVREMRVVADNGAYSAQMPWVFKTLLERNDSLYHIPNLQTRGYLVYTNRVPTGQYRGYGNQITNAAQETLVDKAALELGIDPLQIRLKNCVEKGDVSIHGLHFKSCALKECLKVAAEEIGVNRPTRAGEGVGISCALHLNGNRSGYPPFDGSSAFIRVNEGGLVRLYLGEQDYGQGLLEAITQMVAEVLTIPPDKISLVMKDTDQTPFSIGTLASRETTMGGQAAVLAAEDLKEALFLQAAHLLQEKREEISLQNGLFSSSSGREISFQEAARCAVERNNGLPLLGEGVYHPPDTELPDAEGYGNLSPAYSFAAHGARVRVMEETGEIQVLQLVAVHDSGRILNHNRAVGQVEGGVAQGIGFALLEEYLFSKGQVVSSNLSTYLLPTSCDLPSVKTIFIEESDPTGPFGAKALGEIVQVPTAAAVANATSAAVGQVVNRLPLTPEFLYFLQKNQEEKEGSFV